jgi:DNA polymerase III epsilon subunit family exonuclease
MFVGVVIFIVLFLVYYAVRTGPRHNKTDLSILPDQFIVFDLETTGLNAGTHEIIEIGAIKVNKNSNHHDSFQYLIKPKKKIPKRATEINGITQEMVDLDGRDSGEVIKEFIDFIGDHRLVAYNSDFDMGFLKIAAAEHGYKITNKSSCALKMARRAWPGLKSYKLESLAKMAGLSTSGNHRALKDCELTVTAYMAAAVKLKKIS